MDNQLTAWQPKGAKTIRWVFNIGAGLLAVGALALLIKTFVPTVTDAVILLQTLASNLIYLALTVFALIFVGWLGVETFTSNGSTNKLFAQAYSSFINKMTWELLNVDPLSPLYDKKRETIEKKSVFDEAIARINGTLGHWENKEADYRKKADLAERQARAAKKLLDDGDTTKEPAFRKAAYDAGRLGEQAGRYAERRLRLQPVVKNLGRVQGALDILIANLETDISIARDEWEAQQTMSNAERAARGVLKTSREELAQNAMAIIEQRYGEAFGRLEHLTDLTKPMLDSIDLDQATYSEELLIKWQTESVALLEGPKQAPLQVGVTPVAEPVSAYSSVIR